VRMAAATSPKTAIRGLEGGGSDLTTCTTVPRDQRFLGSSD
jgi:hypothetical protein